MYIRNVSPKDIMKDISLEEKIDYYNKLYLKEKDEKKKIYILYTLNKLAEMRDNNG